MGKEGGVYLIIHLPLLRISQNIVRFVDMFKHLLVATCKFEVRSLLMLPQSTGRSHTH